MINLSLPATNRFASDYLQQTTNIQSFFHYQYNSPEAYKERMAELRNRTFPRQELASHIQEFMSKYPTSPMVTSSIDKLKNPESVVVIGGQQAGILTGPLYSIHKVISIIALAEQKEKELGIPVIPVFWIAGEDHDYPEVNHIFVPNNDKAEKSTIPQKVLQKKMVSDIQLDKETFQQWIQDIFREFGETEHTGNVMDFINQALERTNSFVDIFATIIMELFKEKGLLIVDSGNAGMRNLEKSIFQQQILNQQMITESLLQQQSKMQEANYPLAIESKESAANLFYYDANYNERILLEFDLDTNRFVGKNGAIVFTREQLLEIAECNPEKLSNNVVTRPLTQEWLFPNLAFIAGPGEISYWAELKKIFERFSIKMPPIVPRLNITFMDRNIESDLKELGIDLQSVLTNGTTAYKDRFFSSVKDEELDFYFEDAKKALMTQYGLIEQRLSESDKSLLPLLKKNEDLILKQLDFMIGRVDASRRQKYDVELKKYDRIDLALRPNGIPQERVWNIFQYLNLYGIDFVSRIMALDFVFDGAHKVIKL